MPTQEERDRWRELAELLGLPTDEQSPAQEELEAAVEEKLEELEAIDEREAIRAEQELDAALEEDDQDLIEEVKVADTGETQEGHFLDEDVNLDEGIVEETLDEPREAFGETAEGEATTGETEEDKPRRGKRRRRRGRKGRGQREEQTEGAEETADLNGEPQTAAAREETVAAEEVGEEEGQGRGRRRRRRGRGPVRADRPQPHDEEAAEPDFEEEVALDREEDEEDLRVAVDEDDDLSESDPFKDWNVPSWQDLIAGLYRPER